MSIPVKLDTDSGDGGHSDRSEATLGFHFYKSVQHGAMIF